MSAAPLPRLHTVRMLRGAHEIARADWDALAQRGYHRHAWFVAAESCGAVARHVGVYEDAELSAVIPAYLERTALHGDLHARWYGSAQRLAAVLGGSLRPSLAIGPPMSTASDPLGKSAVLTTAVLDAALELLEEEGRIAGAKVIVWPFVDERATAVRAAARRRGYRESFAGSEAVLDIAWSSPADYLETRSKNVRRTLRGELAWVRDEAIRVTWEEELRPYTKELDSLYRASYRVRNGCLPSLPPSFFAELASERSAGVRVQCAWRGAELLQMAVALDGGGALDLSMSAQSVDERNGLLYQHCLCYDPVRAAIASGLTRIHLGPSALYPKLLRGARLQPRVTLVRGCNPAARAALGALAPITGARNRAKQRRQLEVLAHTGASS